MSVRRRTLVMCTVNPILVGGLAQLVGTQFEIMTRAGISWNSWIKVRAGQPVTLSVGQRLKARILTNPAAVELLALKCGAKDVASLERLFLLPGEYLARAEKAAPRRARHATPLGMQHVGGF